MGWRNRTVLIGRGPELAHIDELLDSFREGTGEALVLRGEPGIGKSALLGYARTQATEARVLSTRGLEAESDLPFAALSELLPPVLDHLAEIPAPQRAALEGALARGPAVPGDRFAAYVGVLSLLAAAADETPVLVSVDDAHWLDSASAEALVFVARRLGNERIALLFAAREGEPARFEAEDLPELRLAGLDEEDAHALLSVHHGRNVSPAVAEQLRQATAGNPLALIELPSVLSQAQLEGREPLEEPLPLGPTIEDAYRRRVAALPERARRALTIAAASDTGAHREISPAFEALGLDAWALAPAEREGIVVVSGEKVEFRHPLLRSASYHASPGPERRAAHKALAHALAGEASPSRRAWHMAAAALDPDDEVASELERAANEALERGAPAAAASAREVAARLSTENAERARRLQESGRDAWLSGRTAEAVRLLEGALEHSEDPLFVAATKHLRGRVEMIAGNCAVARDLFFEAATSTEAHDPPRAPSILADASATLLQEGRPPPALETAQRAEAIAESLGVVDVGTSVICASAESLCGNTDRGLKLGARVKPLLDEGDPLLSPWLVPVFAFNWQCLGNEREALEMIDELLERARAGGALMILPFALASKCDSEFVLGRWKVAYAAGTESVRLAEETGQRGELGHSLAYLARVEAARGDVDECRSRVREAIASAEESGAASITHIAGAALGFLELGIGRAEAAARELSAVEESRLLMGLRQPTVLRSAGDLVEAHFRAGHAAKAEQALAKLEEEAELTNGRWARAVAARCRGLLAGDADFEGHFRRSLVLHEVVPSPFSRARTELCYGERLRRVRRRSDAREHLTRALETFRGLGARPWAKKAERELAATGERVERRPSSEVEHLTPQELQVALAVAEGATNKEVAATLFISPRTVDAHLNRIYRKLGIRSRAELTRVVLRGGLPS